MDTSEAGEIGSGPVDRLSGGAGRLPGGCERFPTLDMPPEEKKADWAFPIASYLKEGRLSYRELEKITGRMSFSKTLLFW